MMEAASHPRTHRRENLKSYLLIFVGAISVLGIKNYELLSDAQFSGYI
jgi:hypothetical protein